MAKFYDNDGKEEERKRRRRGNKKKMRHKTPRIRQLLISIIKPAEIGNTHAHEPIVKLWTSVSSYTFFYIYIYFSRKKGGGKFTEIAWDYCTPPFRVNYKCKQLATASPQTVYETCVVSCFCYFSVFSFFFLMVVVVIFFFLLVWLLSTDLIRRCTPVPVGVWHHGE